MSGRARSAPSEGGEDAVGTALRRKWPLFLAVALFSLGINVLMLTGPIFMLQVYRRVLPAQSTPTLLVLFGLVVLLYLTMAALDVIRSRVLGRVSGLLSGELRRPVFDAVLARTLASAGAPRSDNALREFEVITGFLSGVAITAFYDIPMMLVYLAVIYLFHPILAGYSVLAALALFGLALANDLLGRRPQEEAVRATEAAQKVLASGLRSLEAITALGMVENFWRRWQERHDEATARQMVLRDRIMDISALSRALRLLVQSGILALGAWLVILGEIGAGVMIAASIVLGRALQPVEVAITHWRAWQRYRLARERLKESLQEAVEERQARMPPELAPKGTLEVRGVYAAPPGQREPFLRNITFRVPAGSVLLVLGGNGSGKTMLARLLTGVWRPLDGEILLDGAEISTWPREHLGRIMGYVPQDVALMDGTIAENIARLDPDPEPEEVVRAAQAAGVHEDIKRMGGYERQVGPTGAYLSAGQRQRVALARALYGDPVLVILDEPRNGLDEAGVQALMRSIAGLKERGRTVVLIEHDERFLKLADYLLVLQEGEIRIGGPREKVLAKLAAGRQRPPAPPAGPRAPSAGRPADGGSGRAGRSMSLAGTVEQGKAGPAEHGTGRSGRDDDA